MDGFFTHSVAAVTLKAMPVANNTKLILLIHAALLAFLDPSSDQICRFLSEPGSPERSK
jgi:hypothetical protein